MLSISDTQVVKSSIFVPIPGGDPVSELAILVALGVDNFDPIDVSDLVGSLGDPTPRPVAPITLAASVWAMIA